jgi:MoaA/NifB/PqqE/SkfB family radical SAM enzyme
MKAEIKPGYEKNRVRLADKLPLDTPFTLYITPSHICNFKCDYCTQSWDKKAKEEINFEMKLLEYESFLKLAKQAAEFPGKFKQILFTGLGEPLLNPRTPDMIAELRRIDISEKIEMYTNATMLTHEMTHKLVEAGITRLRISIQGITAEKYKDVCGLDINFDELVSNIRYFYENREDSLLYIKIIDSCLENEDEKNKFYEIFGDICDEIFVEHLVLSQPTMGDYNGRVDESKTLYGEKMVEKSVCPLLFYVLQVDVVGNVFSCTPLGLPKHFSIGNINDTTLLEIWQGKKLKDIRVEQLEKRRCSIPVCNTCQNFLCITHDTDNLDKYADDILKRL